MLTCVYVVGPKAEYYSPKDCSKLIKQIAKKALVSAAFYL